MPPSRPDLTARVPSPEDPADDPTPTPEPASAPRPSERADNGIAVKVREPEREDAKATTAKSIPPRAPSAAVVRARAAAEGRPRPAYRARGVNRWRFIRAYTTTFQVISSYLFLVWTSKILGKRYRDANIKAVHKRNAKRVYE